MYTKEDLQHAWESAFKKETDSFNLYLENKDIIKEKSLLSERDIKVMIHYKEGNSLSGFEGVHRNLVDLDYLDGDLELTQKGREFIKTI